MGSANKSVDTLKGGRGSSKFKTELRPLHCGKLFVLSYTRPRKGLSKKEQTIWSSPAARGGPERRGVGGGGYQGERLQKGICADLGRVALDMLKRIARIGLRDTFIDIGMPSKDCLKQQQHLS